MPESKHKLASVRSLLKRKKKPFWLSVKTCEYRFGPRTDWFHRLGTAVLGADRMFAFVELRTELAEEAQVKKRHRY